MRTRTCKALAGVLLAIFGSSGRAFARASEAELIGVLASPRPAVEVDIVARVQLPEAVEATRDPSSWPGLLRGATHLTVDQDEFVIPIDSAGLAHVELRAAGRTLFEIPSLLAVGRRSIPNLGLPPARTISVRNIPPAIRASGSPVLVRVVPVSVASPCDARWIPADQSFSLEAAPVLNIEGAREGVSVSLFHPLFGERRLEEGTDASSWSGGSTTSVEITVVDPDLRPVPRAAVFFGAARFLLGETTESGKLTLAAPGGRWDVEIRARTGERGHFSHRVTPETGTATLTLPALSVLGGRVVDTNGQGVNGAVVWVADEPILQARTGSDGRFELHGPTLESLTLCAAAPWHVEAAVVVDATREDRGDGLVLVVDAAPPPAESGGGTIRGQVVDSELHGVPGASVFVIEKGADVGLRLLAGRVALATASAETDEAGFFEIDAVAAPGAYELVVRAAGLASRLIEVPELFDAPDAVDAGTIVLDPGRRLLVEVVDRWGEPIEGAHGSVAARLEGGRAHRTVQLRGVSATSDASGVLELDGLPSQVELELRVERPGFRPVSRSLASAAPEQRIRVRLSRALTVSGAVWNPEGLPVEGARVLVLDGSQASATEGSDRPIGPIPTVLSDAAGRFELDDLDCSPLEVRVAAPGYYIGKQRIDPIDCDDTATLGFELQESRRFQGYVRGPSGFPIHGAEVLLQGASARTDANGYFSMYFPQPGWNPLRIVASGFKALESIVVPLDGEEVVHHLVLEVDDSEDPG